MNRFPRLHAALDYAADAHQAQVRKGSEIPYLGHLLGVSSLVIEYGGDEDQAIAGLLHDVLEDCGAQHAGPIREQFGVRVLRIVEACTDGTPERARAQVQRMWDQSGGFGCMLQMGHEWANPAATKRSAELFAAEVMPHFQGQAQPTLDAAARASDAREGLAQTQLQAIEHMTKKYES